MKEYTLSRNTPPDDEDVPFGVEPPKRAALPPKETSKEVADKTVRFFSGEGCEDFIEKEALADLVAYAHSLAATKKEIDAKLEKAKDEIKRRLEGEMTGKKLVKDFGDNQVILHKRAGQTKFDAEKYIVEQMGAQTWAEIEETKEMVREGKVTSPYFTQGKDSVSVEVV